MRTEVAPTSAATQPYDAESHRRQASKRHESAVWWTVLRHSKNPPRRRTKTETAQEPNRRFERPSRSHGQQRHPAIIGPENPNSATNTTISNVARVR